MELPIYIYISLYIYVNKIKGGHLVYPVAHLWPFIVITDRFIVTKVYPI